VIKLSWWWIKSAFTPHQHTFSIINTRLHLFSRNTIELPRLHMCNNPFQAKMLIQFSYHISISLAKFQKSYYFSPSQQPTRPRLFWLVENILIDYTHIHTKRKSDMFTFTGKSSRHYHISDVFITYSHSRKIDDNESCRSCRRTNYDIV
jgi:hypothetical protein